MSDMENFVADIVSAEKVPHIKGSLPLEVVVQSRKFPSTTSKHRKGSLASKPVATGSIGGVHTYALRAHVAHKTNTELF